MYLFNSSNVYIDVTVVVVLAYVFKDTIANIGATLFLLCFPIFNENAKISYKDKMFTFKKIEFIRSVLIDETGEKHLFPNNSLLNEEIIILDANKK